MFVMIDTKEDSFKENSFLEMEKSHWKCNWILVDQLGLTTTPESWVKNMLLDLWKSVKNENMGILGHMERCYKFVIVWFIMKRVVSR